MHNDIVRAKAELTIKTTLTSATASADDVPTPSARANSGSTQTWPLSGPFAPAWPVPAYLANPVRWAWFTEDAWIRRGSMYINEIGGIIDTRRWHGGIDFGVERHGGYRHEIQAVADGVVREFTLEYDNYLVYCPGASGGSRMIDDVFKHDDNESKNGVDCTEIAISDHGRVALTLHEYSDALYIVQYAHRYRFGAGRSARTTPNEDPRTVSAGNVIGTEGGTRYVDGTFVEQPPLRPGLKPPLGDVIVTTEFQVKLPPLMLELSSSRELCTANTLTELRWQISGGRPPYTLTIDGETVDSEAESYRVNCGPIPTDPMGAVPGTAPSKAFSATVTDSRTIPVSVADEVRVALAEALPSVADVEPFAARSYVG